MLKLACTTFSVEISGIMAISAARQSYNLRVKQYLFNLGIHWKSGRFSNSCIFLLSNMRWKVSYFVKMVLNSHHFCQTAPPLDCEHLLSIKTVCNIRTGNCKRHFSKSCCGFRADKWYLSKMVLVGVQTMAVLLRICVMKHSIHAVCQHLIGDTTATSYIDTSPHNSHSSLHSAAGFYKL